MASIPQKKEIFAYWNAKGIIVHKRLTHDMELAIDRALKYSTMEEIKEGMDLYATILEPGVPENQKKYWWSHKWTLVDFLNRGLKKFDGQDAENYKRKQRVDMPEAIVFKRK